MNPKYQKICAEMERTRERVAQGQARLRELEQKKTELENTEIVAAFRAANLPLEKLAEYLRSVTASAMPTQADVPSVPAASARYASTNITEEELDHEA